MKLSKVADHHRCSAGFTLIEALIAFVVLTVGILGALLFHSTLLKESGESKAQVEALKIGEALIEKQRGQTIYGTSADFLNALTSAASNSIPTIYGTNSEYTASWGPVSAVSGADDVYAQTLTVSWAQGTVDLSTFFSWIDPNNTLPADEVGSGDAADYSGDIPIPTGTISAMERLEVVDISSGSAFSAGKEIRDGIQRYTEDGDTVIAVKIDNDTYVRLAKLSEVNNEIFTLSGKIYNSWSGSNDNRRVDLNFGRVWRVSGGSPSYEDEIIDVRATGGANCVITEYSNVDSKAYEAKYVCVAGTGWNGTIYPYFRVLDGNTLSEVDLVEAAGEDAMVCGPRQRSYRYALLTLDKPEDLEQLNEYILGGQVGSVSSATAILDTFGISGSASFAGQSGLVRFYETTSAAEAAASGEGVGWSDYFWHNPDYVVSAPIGSVYDYASAGADSFTGGYQVPSWVSGAASSAYSVNYPGDVAYQNFYLAVPTVKISGTDYTWDCEEVASQALASFASSAASSPLDSAHLLQYGIPGYKSNYHTGSGAEVGYVPSSGAAYSVDDFNLFEWTETVQGSNTTYTEDFRGSIVLGYALTTNTISGYIYYPWGLSAANFEIAGQPEPVISIPCEIGDTAETLVTPLNYLRRSYSCGVPSNWSGNISVYYYPRVGGDSSPNLSCLGVVTTSSAIPSLEDAASGATVSEWEAVSDTDFASYVSPKDAFSAVLNFAKTEGLASTATISDADAESIYANFYSSVGESLTDQNFYFGPCNP